MSYSLFEICRLYLRSKSNRVEWLNNQLKGATTEYRISTLMDLAIELELSANAETPWSSDDLAYAMGIKEFREKALIAHLQITGQLKK